MNWIQLGGSLAAVLVLAGIAWALKLGGATLGEADAACRLAEERLAGFKAREAHLATHGETAVVLGQDGSVAAIRRHGAQFLVRRLARPVAATRADVVVTVFGTSRTDRFVLPLASEKEARLLTAMLGSAPDA